MLCRLCGAIKRAADLVDPKRRTNRGKKSGKRQGLCKSCAFPVQ
jgi:hypothetical protein